MTDTGVVLICFSRRSEASRTKAHFPPFTTLAAGVQSIYPNPLLNQQLRANSGPQPDAASRFLVAVLWLCANKAAGRKIRTRDGPGSRILLAIFSLGHASDYLAIAKPTSFALHSCRPAAPPQLATLTGIRRVQQGPWP